MSELFTSLHRRYAGGGITRREMVQRSLLAAAGLLLSERFTARPGAAAAGRVVVIGAGFSGLTAA
jgi:hypothetical protein